jgi:hypothetical protein
MSEVSIVERKQIYKELDTHSGLLVHTNKHSSLLV